MQIFNLVVNILVLVFFGIDILLRLVFIGIYSDAKKGEADDGEDE